MDLSPLNPATPPATGSVSGQKPGSVPEGPQSVPSRDSELDLDQLQQSPELAQYRRALRGLKDVRLDGMELRALRESLSEAVDPQTLREAADSILRLGQVERGDRRDR